jgi:TRAP-type transport system small permease protein
MTRVVETLHRILTALAGVLFGALFLVTVLNITLRNIGGIAWLWIPGMMKFLFIWTVFIGTAVLYYRDDHLIMDYFVARMPAARRRILDIVANAIFLVFLLVLIVYGFQIARVRMGIPFETWNFPTGYAFAAVPVAALLMVAFCIYKLVTLVKGERHE